LRLLSIYSSS